MKLKMDVREDNVRCRIKNIPGEGNYLLKGQLFIEVGIYGIYSSGIYSSGYLSGNV